MLESIAIIFIVLIAVGFLIRSFMRKENETNGCKGCPIQDTNCKCACNTPPKKEK